MFRFSLKNCCCKLPIIFIGTWDSCVNYSCKYWECNNPPTFACNHTSLSDGNPAPNTRDEQYDIDKAAWQLALTNSTRRIAFGNIIGGSKCWSLVSALNPVAAVVPTDSFGDFEYTITAGTGHNRITPTNLEDMFQLLYNKYAFADNNQAVKLVLLIDNTGSTTEANDWSVGAKQDFKDWLPLNYPKAKFNEVNFTFTAPFYERYLKIVEDQFASV